MALSFYSGPDYLALPREPQPWVIKNLVPVGGLTNIYGKPKTGKSYAALGMGLAVGNNDHDWQGFDVLKHGKVAYLQVDTPREEWAGRVARLNTAGFNTQNIYFADMNTVPYPFNVLDEAIYKQLHERMQELRPVLTIIDTLRESFAGDENNSDTMRNVISNLVAATRYEGGRSAIVLLSHQRKDGIMATSGAEDLMDDNRGSSYVPGRMDVIVRLTPRSLTYKGRATGQKTVSVEQDEELGLIYVPEQRERFIALNATRRILADPTVPVKEKTARNVAKMLYDQKVIKESDETFRKLPDFLALFAQVASASARI